MSCEEGERRGQLAEFLGASYLYSLSESEEIDAQFVGSLMKYANNAFQDMANCKSRVLHSQGRKHICLFAATGIEPGEELLFDYGYSSEKRSEIEWMH